MGPLILLSPLVCIIIFVVSPKAGEAIIYSLCFCLLLAGVDFLIDRPTHAHNPLGRLSGTFMIVVFNGPTVLVCAIVKELFSTKAKRK